jgi:hypothetical protein
LGDSEGGRDCGELEIVEVEVVEFSLFCAIGLDWSHDVDG